MKRLITLGLALALVIALGTTAVLAGGDQIPSAKAAFQSQDVQGVTFTSGTDDTTVQILEAQIKTGEPKDLLIDVSAVCGLVTDVSLKGVDGSESIASISIQVWVDKGTENEQLATPGTVVFANRILEIAGDLSHHYLGVPFLLDDHEVEIFLETCSANSFNFCAYHVGSGVHTVTVEAIVSTEEKGYKGTAEAWIGLASVVVDEVFLKIYPE